MERHVHEARQTEAQGLSGRFLGASRLNQQGLNPNFHLSLVDFFFLREIEFRWRVCARSSLNFSDFKCFSFWLIAVANSVAAFAVRRLREALGVSDFEERRNR